MNAYRCQQSELAECEAANERRRREGGREEGKQSSDEPMQITTAGFFLPSTPAVSGAGAATLGSSEGVDMIEERSWAS